jgi:hypothetical protein
VALVAVGAILAELEPIVIVALTAAAGVLVALVGRAFGHEPAPARDETPVAQESQELAVPEHAEAVAVEPARESKPEAEPELAVSERSARAILATGPPPVQEPPARTPDFEPEPEPEPERDLEPEAEHGVPSREWNIWELQHLVRDRPDDDRHEEWAALVVSLRDFARVDGTLPPEFDDLVRDSFGDLLAVEDARTKAAAAP